jgi:hypothetical protein
MNTEFRDDAHDLIQRRHSAIQVADTSLMASPLQGRWWRVTKLMIEWGSERFWRRRGMQVPGGETFAARRTVEVAEATQQRNAAAQ